MNAISGHFGMFRDILGFVGIFWDILGDFGLGVTQSSRYWMLET